MLIFIIFIVVVLQAYLISYLILAVNKKSSKIKKRKFLETGDLNSLTVDDIVNEPELEEYLTNPTKYRKLADSIKKNSIQKSREVKIDELLN